MAKRQAAAPPEPDHTPTQAITASIRLLASSPDLPPHLLAPLLASLGKAHASAVKLEDEADRHGRKRVKREEGEEPQERAQAGDEVEEDKPLPPLLQYPYASVQGALTELERMIPRDVESAQPFLDKLGILLRPLKAADGKVDLTVWEGALPMPPDSKWRRTLLKPKLYFGADYPAAEPKLKLAANFFHPNVLPRGVIATRCTRRGLLDRTLGPEISTMLKVLEMAREAQLGKAAAGAGTRTRFCLRHFVFLLPWRRRGSLLRTRTSKIPLNSKRTRWPRREPDQYNRRVQALFPTLLPSPNDVEDLIQAQRRAEWRKATGQEPTLASCLAKQ